MFNWLRFASNRIRWKAENIAEDENIARTLAHSLAGPAAAKKKNKKKGKQKTEGTVAAQGAKEQDGRPQA